MMQKYIGVQNTTDGCYIAIYPIFLNYKEEHNEVEKHYHGTPEQALANAVREYGACRVRVYIKLDTKVNITAEIVDEQEAIQDVA